MIGVGIMLSLQDFTDTNSNNICDTSIYSRGQGIALPLLQSVKFFFQIGMIFYRYPNHSGFLAVLSN